MARLLSLLFFLGVTPAWATAAGGDVAQIMPLLPMIGIVLLVLEFFLPTKGVLGFIGVTLFICGTFGLSDHPDPDLRLSMPTILALNAIILFIAGIVIAITIRGYRSKNARQFDLAGRTARVIDWSSDKRRVEIDGQIWRAQCPVELDVGQTVRIMEQNNLTLHVTPEN